MSWAEFIAAVEFRDFGVEISGCTSPLDVAVKAMSLLPDRDNADSIEVVCIAVWTFLVEQRGQPNRGPLMDGGLYELDRLVRMGADEHVSRQLFLSWWD